MESAKLLPLGELKALSSLIERIYQGATEPARWTGIVSAIAEWLDAPKALIFTYLHTPNRGGFYFNQGIPESMMELWKTKYQTMDLWASTGTQKGVFFEGNVLLGDEIVPHTELIASRWYKEFLSLHDIAQVVTSIVFGADSPDCMPVAGSFYRGARDARFAAEDKQKLAILVPHISRSLGVMNRLQDADLNVAASRAALDRLGVGVVLLERSGNVAFANRAALRMLEEEDGLRLRNLLGGASMGCLIADSGNVQQSLAKAISGATDLDILATAHFGRFLSIPRKSGSAPYTAHFSSLRGLNEFGDNADAPCAVMFLTSMTKPISVDPEMLRHTYGLTKTEIRVVEMLLQGGTMAEVAAHRSVSVNTLKSQIKQIYVKTGVDSRAMLIKLILSLSLP